MSNRAQKKERKLNLRTGCKIFFFLAVLSGLIQIFSYIPRQRSHEKNGNYWPYFFNELPEDSVDVIFMGSSHSNSTFIPEIIDDILDINSIHVNTSGESIYQTALEYREVLRHQQPRMVIIETYPIFDGLTQEDLKPWNYSFFFAVPSIFRQMLYAHQFFSIENLIYFYLPYTLYHADWKKPGGIAQRMVETVTALISGKGQLELAHKGYFNYMESLPPLKAGVDEDDPPAVCAVADLKQRLETTKEIMNLDSENAPALMFVEAPQLVNEFEACRREVIEAIRNWGGDYQVLLQDQERPRLWFGDHEHMTQFGAVIASVELARLLAEKLDLKVDTRALAYYQTYFFNDYKINRDGREVEVNLIPYDGEAISDLYFTWTLHRDGEEIEKIEGLRQNELTVTLPASDGKYYFHVEIYNPAGAYLLRGNLNIPVE